jgi:hypothetical protein
MKTLLSLWCGRSGHTASATAEFCGGNARNTNSPAVAKSKIENSKLRIKNLNSKPVDAGASPRLQGASNSKLKTQNSKLRIQN